MMKFRKIGFYAGIFLLLCCDLVFAQGLQDPDSFYKVSGPLIEELENKKGKLSALTIDFLNIARAVNDENDLYYASQYAQISGELKDMCRYQMLILLCASFIEDKHRIWLYQVCALTIGSDMDTVKSSMERFQLFYPHVKHPATLHLADKLKETIRSIEPLFDKVQEFYKKR